MEINTKKLKDIVEKNGRYRNALIPILQDIQEEYNWLPKETLEIVAKELGIPLMDVYGVTTFFRTFSLEPRGEHIITVCIGTACHVQGAPGLIEALEDELGIKVGETTKDMKFTLETARCFGCCGLAPVITVNEEVHGKLKRADIPRIVKQYKSMEEKQDA